jgi:PAS domain S-box-containing protein
VAVTITESVRQSSKIHLIRKQFPAEPQNLRPRRLAGVLRSMYLRVVIAVGAVVLLVAVVELVRHPVGRVWFILSGLTLLTAWATLRMPTVAASFSVSDTFTISGALLFGPAAGTVLVALDALVMSFRIPPENRTRVRLIFNVTAPALAMWVAAHGFFIMSGTGPLATNPAAVQDLVAPLGIFAAVYFLLNTAMVAMAVAIERGASVLAVWREHFSVLWLTYFGGTSIAALALMTMAAPIDEAMTLALVAPLLILLYATFRMGVGRSRDKLAHFVQLSAYVAALRSTADAVLVTDVQGRITLMNPMAERLTGWPEREAHGRAESEVFRIDQPLTSTPVLTASEARGGIGRECVLVRPDGTSCAIEEVHAPVRDEHDDAIGVIRTFRDVSHRKAIEAEREALLERERSARAAADTANRMKDEFLATLSHELRTPANAVLGWTRLLKSGRLDEIKTRRAFESLERSALGQAALLNDLLDMSHIVRGTLRLETRMIDVLDPLREAISTVEPALLSKDIPLRLDVGPVTVRIDADPDRLRQVFWNVLANAVKFSRAGEPIAVTVVGGPIDVQIDVVDSGAGIHPDVLPFIFDRFRQGDSSTTRVHPGLGIGLAIVRHLVESHGGSVTAASDGEGRGARFTIRLPIRRAVDGPPPSNAPGALLR